MSGLSTTEIIVYLLAGATLGLFYFYALFQTIRLHAAQAALSRILPLYLLRGGVALGSFWLVAQQGALPLLLTLAGFLCARFISQRFWGVT